MNRLSKDIVGEWPIKGVALVVSLVFLLNLSALAAGSFTNHINEVDGGYNYILYQPDSVTGRRPLIVTLHSRGASGSDLAQVDRFGTIDAIRSGMKLDAVVVAPQATGDSWDSEKIMRVIDRVVATCDIDTNRIYAIGMSMGGNGVADLVASYPDRFAAAIVLAGSTSEEKAANLNRLPLWVIRGTKDREGAIAATDRLVKAMRSQPDKAPRLVYTKVNGLDHRQHERLLYVPYFYDWMLSHRLDALNRPVNTTFEITDKLLKNAYKGLNLRPESAAKRKSGPRRRAGGPMGRGRW